MRELTDSNCGEQSGVGCQWARIIGLVRGPVTRSEA